MRWNSKKHYVAGGVGLVTFVVLYRLFYILYWPDDEVPKVPEDKQLEMMETRLLKLEKELNTQYTEFSKLLETVKRLYKTEIAAKIENHIVGGGEGLVAPPRVTVLPILVIACDRVTVRRCLDNLIKFRPNKDTFPIIVSQDCGHRETGKVIKSYIDSDPSITWVQQPDKTEIPLPRSKVKYRGYYNIARHFRFALNHVFKTLSQEAVIIVEDDLDISPDFFEYFQGTYPLLLQDPTLWCISAWNDNGRRDSIDLAHPELLHRTDFFPGLGWLLRKDTWLDLEPHWPPAFFDDWLRDPVNTHGRSCIRPEISRTYTFGKMGVSKGLFFDVHLRHMHLNDGFVEFTKLNLTYLLKPNYDNQLLNTLSTAQLLTADDVMALPQGHGETVKVLYKDAKSYQKAAKKMGLMDDFRSGIPRTAYRGIVSCFIHGRRVFLAPAFPWVKYDPTWG